jgi:uncharacterized repeat protein (TIGR01451 family)
LPAVPGSVATNQATRTPSSISGTIVDSLNNPIAGAVVTDPSLGSTVSASDGKYSFYSTGGSGNALLTAAHPNYVFPSSPVTVAITGSNQQVHFIGVATVNLSVNSTVSPNPVVTEGLVTQTIVAANGGPATASNAIVTVSLPNALQLVSATSSRGTCSTVVPISCALGALPRSANAVVVVTARPATAGVFALSAAISGPDPDSDVTNNSSNATLTVNSPEPTVITVLPVSPNSGSGGSQAFTFQFGDTAGAADLVHTWIWFNPTLATSAAASCLVYYTVATNTLSLLNDAGTVWLQGTLGAGGLLQNSQCAIALGSSTAALSGDTLTLQLATTFAAAFNGSKSVFLYAANDAGVSSGWQTRGTWTVTP